MKKYAAAKGQGPKCQTRAFVETNEALQTVQYSPCARAPDAFIRRTWDAKSLATAPHVHIAACAHTAGPKLRSRSGVRPLNDDFLAFEQRNARTVVCGPVREVSTSQKTPLRAKLRARVKKVARQARIADAVGARVHEHSLKTSRSPGKTSYFIFK